MAICGQICWRCDGLSLFGGVWLRSCRAWRLWLGGRYLEELQFRGFEDGREVPAVQALEGRGGDGVGRVDPGRAVVAVAFLQEGREDRPVVPVWGIGDEVEDAEIDVAELAIGDGGPAFRRADWLVARAGVVGRDECRGCDGEVAVLHDRAEEVGFDDLLEGRFAVVLEEDIPVDEGRGLEVVVPLRLDVQWRQILNGFGLDEKRHFQYFPGAPGMGMNPRP